MPGTTNTATTREGDDSAGRSFVRRGAAFAWIGLALYAAAYVAAEQIADRHAGRNRFHAIASLPPTEFHHAILGASHAVVLDYRDLTSRLEAMSGTRIVNLAIVGAGVVPNRLVFDYFRTRHRARSIVYVVDSFAFYSPQWNEERLADARLYRKAPFDPTLAKLLFSRQATWLIGLDYASGFSKVNDPDRFVTDLPAEEGARFDRVYRPIPQLDRERLAYLYPRAIEPAVVVRYIAELEALVVSARREDVGVQVIKPPLPARIRQALPDEASFDSRLVAMLDRHGARFDDLSATADDDRHFADTDHLNQAGVLALFERMAPLLSPAFHAENTAFLAARTAWGCSNLRSNRPRDCV